ncbi:thioredoxin domain-containing protein [Sphingomonas immobilis]|uniref:Thioredoxin domain-containing protein n=1 Tax=Sphingomonas immobilis TaxID=3063997 RepID=A0ABT8ZZQ9_9SPHN|nr:thioredoxin domain-containing protein [Sphingomonas sp. CA1-15]MDO7843072.1 thioredoxin domain-containing protein [Sphingomonas sp. CA1-15]
MRVRTVLAMLALGLLAASAQAAPPKKAPARKVATDWTRTVVATPEGGYRMGNPAAPLKLVEYGSRTCPHCALFDREGLPALKAKYIAKGQVSYEFRDFPIHNALDLGPILLGRCVPARFFFPILGEMMAKQQSLLERPAIPEDEAKKLDGATPNQIAAYLARYYGYVDLMKARGLPEAKALACLSDKVALTAAAKRAGDAAQQFEVRSTPTFILNGKKVADTASWEPLEAALKAAGAK